MSASTAESCIKHVAEPELLIIRNDYVRITQQDHCAAALLAWLEYRTNGELPRLKNSKVHREPWITSTFALIEADLCKHYTFKTIRAALDKLVRLGFVQTSSTTKEDREKGTRFLFKIETIQTAIGREVKEVSGKFQSGKFQSASGKFQSVTGELQPASGKFPPTYKEAESSTCMSESNQSNSEPKTNTPPSEETQEQNTNAIAEPGVLREIEFTEFDDWTNDGGDAVIAALRRQKGIKLSPKQRQTIREKLVMVLIREGLIDETAYRFALWAREHNKAGEPQLICYGRWLKCLKGEESLDIDPPDLPSTPVSLPPIDLQPISPKSPPDIPLASPHNGLPPLALRWNEVVHSGPPVVAWKEQSNGDFLLRTLMSDLAFQRESETALAKAEKLCAAKHPKGSYLTFGWFIKPGKWCEVLNGQHDWLLGDGPAQQPKKGMGALIEQFKAECEAKKGDKNLDSRVE